MKTFKRILAIYLLLSLLISVAYNLDRENAWQIASHRCGLLVVNVRCFECGALEGPSILNPFCNAGDCWIACIGEHRTCMD